MKLRFNLEYVANIFKEKNPPKKKNLSEEKHFEGKKPTEKHPRSYIICYNNSNVTIIIILLLILEIHKFPFCFFIQSQEVPGPTSLADGMIPELNKQCIKYSS